MPPLVYVLLGGAVGAGFRYQVGALVLRRLGPGLPWGTWIINLAGGFLMGLLAGTLTKFTPERGEPLRLLLGVGMLGGFTTFSAFSLETANMLIRGQTMLAMTYALSSVIGSVLLLLAGLYLVRLT